MSSSPSGLKGLLQKTGKLVINGSVVARDWGLFAYRYGGNVAFCVATVCVVTFGPLMFEVAREAQGLESERALAKEYTSKGFSHQQLQEMGFRPQALHAPAVAGQ